MLRLLAAALAGAAVAALIFLAVLYVADLEIVEQRPTNEAPVPLGVGTGEPVTVPSVVGLDPIDAQRKLEEAGLLTAVSQEATQRTPLVVVDQVPPAGTEIKSGGSVQIELAEK